MPVLSTRELGRCCRPFRSEIVSAHKAPSNWGPCAEPLFASKPQWPRQASPPPPYAGRRAGSCVASSIGVQPPGRAVVEAAPHPEQEGKASQHRQETPPAARARPRPLPCSSSWQPAADAGVERRRTPRHPKGGGAARAAAKLGAAAAARARADAGAGVSVLGTSQKYLGPVSGLISSASGYRDRSYLYVRCPGGAQRPASFFGAHGPAAKGAGSC
eukprot:scaffold306_cov525-Prasinococcus_capsulatus_cf.AAC.18